MTVRVEQTFDVSASPETVWNFIADPEKRARAISVVDGFEETGDRTAVWQIELPLPLLNRTISVETEETDRDPPTYVRFVGRSSAVHVVGEHRLEATEDGSQLTNRFIVDGKLPGVERFFKGNLEDELRNLRDALYADLNHSG
ncbi:CoxG family protein [Halocatena salina]|uniref:SRPBCC family protein n=1 Tax=Halocatena salina TaxID=2934340 RepID=A0A8U0A1L0_9EURY|nr:SRPBCC family protein [Halocatena salina]UPM42328.1 SRPBCC family protein [Halocatena salina]